MGFNHMRVSTLLADTEKYITRNVVVTTDVHEQATRARLTRTVDDMPNVHTLLATFCETIRGELRGIKFAYARRGSKVMYDEGIATLRTLWAYYPGDEYAVGMVGYADFAVSGVGDNKYGVYSRKIKNEKFSEQRDQYFMTMSDKLNRAVWSAKKYLRRYGLSEIAEMSLDDFQSRLSSAGWKLQAELSDARSELFGHPSFDAELRSMLINGYQFNCPLLGNAVRTYVARKDAHEAHGNAPVHGWFVSVRDEFGHQVFDVIEAYDIRRASHRSNPSWSGKAMLPNELPEDLTHKLAALSMLSDDNYVEGLGLRVSPTSYWVVR